MIYVFDTSSFIVISHYFPDRFPSFWNYLSEYVTNGKIISVKEVFNELDTNYSRQHLREWIKINRSIFRVPEEMEMAFITQIFSIQHFQYLVTQKQLLKGTPVADPFIIASAKINDACVVTEEEKKKNASRIPNVCEYFGIECTNLEGFMEKENWEF
jgi:hypothetical protein